MLRSLKSLERYRVTAVDGDLGGVQDFFVDDESWTLRYLVVDTGEFVGGRKVLITPISFREVDWSNRRVHLALTRDKIMKSPDVDTDRPVSRQHELLYSGYYGYGTYWGAPGSWGGGVFPDALATTTKSGVAVSEEGLETCHLRSVHELRNYHIQGTDGPVGHVVDFILEDETWALPYLVADTSNWWLGKRVLVPPRWATRVSWAEGNVYLNVTREKIKASPVWDGAPALARSYEERLHQHYGRTLPAAAPRRGAA